jgi:hypothetical protein
MTQSQKSGKQKTSAKGEWLDLWQAVIVPLFGPLGC